MPKGPKKENKKKLAKQEDYEISKTETAQIIRILLDIGMSLKQVYSLTGNLNVKLITRILMLYELKFRVICVCWTRKELFDFR